MTLGYFVVKARIYMASLLDFINFISWTIDIQDVSARTAGGQVTFQRQVRFVRPL